MALKTIAVKTNSTAPKAGSTKVPSFVASKDLDLTGYAVAVKAKREAERIIAEQEPAVKAEALHHLFLHNTANPDGAVATVRLFEEVQDSDMPTEVRVSFQSRYSAPNAEAADAMFTELGKDINDYVIQRAAAKFDDSVFLTKSGDQKGEFNQKIFNAYQKAVEKATAELVKAGLLPVGTTTPLATFPVVSVRPDFHDKRWTEFPTVAAQERVTEVLKNTVSATVE